MSDTSKVFDAKKIVTTLASLNNQNAKFFGIPVEYPEKSTLNEHLKFLQNILPGNDVYPNACYMCIGDRGHMLTVDSEGDGVAVPIKHDPTDAAPYRIRPFVMRPIDDDLSDEAREKYAGRILIEVNGKRYWAYYLMRLSMAAVKVQRYKITVRNKVRTVVPFVYNDTNLYPVRPEMPDYNYDYSDQSTLSDGDYVQAVATVRLALDETDIANYLNVCKILNGSPEKSAISEFCLVSGVDYMASGESYTGSQFTYNEVIGAQVATFLTTFVMASLANSAIGYDVTVGQTLPLPVRAAVSAP